MLPWIKRHLSTLAGALLALFGVSALVALRRRKRALATAERDVAVIQARAKVDELRAVRAVLEADHTVRTEKLDQIDREIAEHKSQIATVQTQHGLTAEEISAEFSKLGY